MRIEINNKVLDEIELQDSEKLVDSKWYRLKSGREHYRLCAYLSTYFNSTKILDIGTYRGTSAVALSHNRNNVVLSYDIKNVIPKNHVIHSIPNVVFNIKNVLDDLDSEMIKSVKLILIDIDHMGKNEELIMKKLREVGFKGLVLIDDINHPDKVMKKLMQEFWNNIKEDKYDVTSYGHTSGSGLVLFDDTIELVFE